MHLLTSIDISAGLATPLLTYKINSHIGLNNGLPQTLKKRVVRIFALTDAAETRLIRDLSIPLTSATISAMSARESLVGPPTLSSSCKFTPTLEHKKKPCYFHF